MSPFKGRGSEDDPYQINIITSDITYMKDTYCVAGWNPHARQMKRLMINGRHWQDDDLKRLGKYSLLQVSVLPKEGGRDYPHKTEDTLIDENFKIVRAYDDPTLLAKDLQTSVSKNIDAAFDGNLKDNSYIPFKTQCSSLGAVVLPARNIAFYKGDGGKLRVEIKDGDGSDYDLRVTCKYLRDVIDPMKAAEFKDFTEEILNSDKQAHVRVGVAKPYVYKDNNCYLMCNGVFFF